MGGGEEEDRETCQHCHLKSPSGANIAGRRCDVIGRFYLESQTDSKLETGNFEYRK